MLPTNVMSFMKKMVAVGPGEGGTVGEGADTALSKIRQTLSSSLMTAQDKVTKLSPRSGDSQAQAQAEVKAEESKPTPKETGPKVSKFGTCRVCLKSFKEDDEYRTCNECNQKVCEDCASYSKPDDTSDHSLWRCSICRRRAASRAQVLTQESTDSLLEPPVLEALQRRHSEAKLGASTSTVSSGLAPPRTPDLRRHSDVSPASLKELEKAVLKVQGERSDWRRGSRAGVSPGGSRLASPSVERRAFPQAGSGPAITATRPSEDPEPGSSQPQVQPAIQQIPTSQRPRRMSRVTKQHSYDEDVKPTTTHHQAQEGSTPPSLGLGSNLPSLPRRASAYDVYAPRSELPSVQPSRRASFRAAPITDPNLDSQDPSGDSSGQEEERRPRRRASHLPDTGALRGLQKVPPKSQEPETPVRRQTSVQDGEAIKIVIHDVDCDTSFGARSGTKRRITLKRDPTDKTHRTRGFGMRVVGGKVGGDGRLFAYIVWTVPSGPAEKAGLQQADKVLEWGGVSLVDKTFEEVCAIMDRTGDAVDLLVEQGTDLRMCDLLDEPSPSNVRKNSGDAVTLQLADGDIDKSPVSPTRRKLPKTPGGEVQTTTNVVPATREPRPVQGRVQLQVGYNDDRGELIVSVFAADDLAPREDGIYGPYPEAYVQLRLLPLSMDVGAVKTDVSEPTINPMWNTTLELPAQPGDPSLFDRQIEVTLWDYRPDQEQIFLGECWVDISKGLLDDTPVWYRLEDPRMLRSGASRSPRSSIASDTSIRTLRGNRSQSEETSDMDLEGLGLLHPDHAYLGTSRRGSSQSEQLEFEPYQLPDDLSKSLPGSRRSSFQSGHDKGEEGTASPPVIINKERRRSSICRAFRDPDEILKSLKQVKGELMKNDRKPSFQDKRRASRRASVAVLDLSALRKKDWKESGKEDSYHSSEEEEPDGSEVELGPGQIQPRASLKGKHAEVKLNLLMTKGQLEVEVICARELKGEPTDTYVKTYLRDGDKWSQKRKTRVVRHSRDPQFGQTLKYAACDILGRTLVVMVWEHSTGFEHNKPLGGAELALDRLTLTQPTHGWYPLFPIHSLPSGQDSP